MKIKVVKPDGSSTLHECEDVTVTFYTEGTIAFKRALVLWQNQVAEAKGEWEAVASRSSATNNRLATLKRQVQLVANRTNEVDEWEARSWLSRLWVRLVHPAHLRERETLDQERTRLVREMAQAKAQHREAANRERQSKIQYESLRDDPLTPGIDLALRSRSTRRLIKLGLPTDGNAAYVMNDEGKTIDIYRWPPDKAKMEQVKAAEKQAVKLENVQRSVDRTQAKVAAAK